MPHTAFATTTRGLDRNHPAMRLFEKAKKYGVWNPSDIDLRQDKGDWLRLSDVERDTILRLTAMFQAGEEAVTLDLLPLVMTIAQEGRLEEEMFLTSFLWEEAKHTDFFRRFLDEVAHAPVDLSQYHTPNYQTIFYETLPAVMNRLLVDRSPAAQIAASVTYNMVVEGVLAETGYHAYLSALARNHLMPGQCHGIALLKQDESRHIAYGIFLISRLLAEDDTLWAVIEEEMNRQLVPALGVISDTFACYDPMPFGLDIDEFIHYAMHQFQKRLDRIERARGASLDDVVEETQMVIDQDAA
jgi:ribonucleoside-diphosphate reductase beta chain